MLRARCDKKRTRHAVVRACYRYVCVVVQYSLHSRAGWDGGKPVCCSGGPPSPSSPSSPPPPRSPGPPTCRTPRASSVASSSASWPHSGPQRQYPPMETLWPQLIPRNLFSFKEITDYFISRESDSIVENVGRSDGHTVKTTFPQTATDGRNFLRIRENKVVKRRTE